MIHYKLDNTHQERTLHTLHQDNKEFQSRYNSDKKHASRCNNSRYKPLLDIELDYVAPPYLHILLGVVLKHHRHLEAYADKIDFKITLEPFQNLTQMGKRLKAYGSKWKLYKDTKDKIVHLKTCYIVSRDKKYKKQLNEQKKILRNIQFECLSPRTGPVASNLDEVLKKHRITPQAYHSRSFVGNHCHRYLQPKVYEDLTQSIITQATACTNSPFIIDEAWRIKMIFDDLNNELRQVHELVSHTRTVSRDDLGQIKAKIDAYMRQYRLLFPKKIIPKQHLLEYHCESWISRHKFGLGLLGEQGTESTHQAIGKLQVRARGINDCVKKMKFVMDTHLLQVAPRLHVNKTTDEAL